MKSLLLVTLVLAFTPEVDARCAMTGLRPAVLTPTQIAIPADGGIVVAAEADPVDRDLPEGDVAVQKAWRFRNGKLLVEPTLDVIAPGLVVYRYPASKDKLELENAKHQVVATVAMTKDQPALLAAPKVKQIVARKWRGRRASTTVEVVLDGAQPETAVAIVAVDAKGKPLSFGRIEPGQQQQAYIYVQRRCQIVSDGTVEPKAGDRVSVFWLDAMGRRSPATKPIAITAVAVGGQP